MVILQSLIKIPLRLMIHQFFLLLELLPELSLSLKNTFHCETKMNLPNHFHVQFLDFCFLYMLKDVASCFNLCS